MLPQTVELHDERLVIREAVADDVSFIFPSWMECARQLRQTRRAVFDKFYPDRVRELLETEPAVVMMREGKTAIHAWACGRPPNLLHFAYVPEKLRRHGFGRAVITAVLESYPATVFVTSSPLSLPNHPRFIFNPFLTRTA